MQLLINHLGYEPQAPKQAILVTKQPQLDDTKVRLVNADNGEVVANLNAVAQADVANWQRGFFHRIDFSHLTQSGQFYLAYAKTYSQAFDIKDQNLLTTTFSDLLHYFKSQRCSGEFERHDRQVKLYDSQQRIDARGGWYDASGDVSKYLSHLS